MEKTGKSGPLMETDLEFLGYHNVEREDPEYWGFPQRTCRVFNAQIQAGIAPDTHWFIYLLTGCQDEDIQKVDRVVLEGIFKPEKCFIVIPDIMKNRNALKRLQDRKRVYIFDDLMWEKINEKFSEYIEKEKERIDQLQAKNYVTPQVENNGKTLPSKAILDMLSDKRDKRTEERIAVIKADAGAGKTTLAARLASLLIKQRTKNRLVPLLLTGQAGWRGLIERSHNANNLGDIIISLLEVDGADFPLRDTEQFTRIMELGYFAFIFDGFDELTKPSGAGSLSPRENFDWLANITTGSNARIMLTTRISFWDREISSQTAEQHEVFSLKPFNSESVYGYFNQYFTGKPNDDVLIQKAKEFYKKLQEPQGDDTTEDSFFNLPACAMMIADEVERGGGSDFKIEEDIRNPARRLFMQILRREDRRQQTGIKDINAMHEVFENTAIYGNEFELLHIATDPKCPIEPDKIEIIADHAFLGAKESDGGSKKWIFKNDFLFHYLQASCICRLILEEERGSFGDKYRENRDLKALIDSEADGSGHLSEQVSHYLDVSDMDKVVDSYNACPNRDAFFDSLKSFLFHIIAKTVISRGKSESRRERGDTILSLLEGKEARSVSNLHVRGELDEISLSDWTIRDSRFVDFSLGERGSHDGLLFIDCHFSGNLSLPESFGSENFKECKGDGPAKLVLHEIGQAKINEEDIRKHLESVLKRFWRGARARLKSVSEGHWSTGRTVAIEQSYNLLEILKQEKVVEQHKHRALLQIEKNSINDVKEFMVNGIVQGRVHAVFKRMNENID